MAATVIFYHAPGSSSMAVLIALLEVGAAFEQRVVKLGDHPPEFRGLTPEGKVPVLVVDGRKLTEVAGVLYYLARRFPEAGLFPAGDVAAEAEVVSWMSFVASTLHPARRQGMEHARAMYSVAERRLGGREWAVGEYSIADIHLFRLFWRFHRLIGAERGDYPGLYSHFDRMMGREAVRACIAADEAVGYSLPV